MKVVFRCHGNQLKQPNFQGLNVKGNILFYPIPHGLFNLRADSWAFLRSRPFHYRQPLKVKVSEIPRVVLQDQTKSAKDTTEYVALLPSQLDY